MKNIDAIFNILLEKESLKKSLQKRYVRLKQNHHLNEITNSTTVKNISFITFQCNEVHVYIALETLNLFQYKVLLWYEFKGLFSQFYGKQYYRFKSQALKYIHEIKNEFNTKNIDAIILKHIQVLDRDCNLLNEYLKTKS